MNQKVKDVFSLIAIAAIIIAVVAGLTCLLVALSDAKDRRVQRDNICHYLGGNVEGSVCIKDGKVISTKPVSK